MDLVKIYNDSDFSEASVPPGEILIFTGRDSYGNAVTRYKDSSGDFGTLSGSGGSTDVILGQVDADGNFQPLTFNGTEAANSGDPETVENYYGWNGVLPVPDNGIKVGEATEYYKCASVDTSNKTWSGYKAVLTDGVYSFEETVTEGLTYGTAYTPKQDGIYSADATVQVNQLWDGNSNIILRFQIDEVRDGNGVQMGELVLFNTIGEEEKLTPFITGNVTADPENDSPASESPEMLVDGNSTTKWFSWVFNSPSYVQFPVSLHLSDYPQYGWYTANDSAGRDPISWQLLMSDDDGVTWTVLSKMSGEQITTSRTTLAGKWNIVI